MSLLIPLGLLGLLSLIVLFIIYIIKPNYQQKLVSSSFVWKLSLKYQKKRIPISKLRNLLILLCQIFILALLAFLLAQPAIVDKGMLRDNEKVVVIDASASMLAVTKYDDSKYTRFEQAVDELTVLVDEVFDKNGTLTIILAGAKAEALFTRVRSDAKDEVMQKLAEMKSSLDNRNNPTYCTYGSADIEGAMALAENVTTENPLAEVMLYTGKQYLNSNGVTVVDMSRGAEEVNVAILDVRAVMEEGYYTFYADVVAYGENVEVDINFLVNVDVYSSSGAEYADPVQDSFHRYLVAGEVTTVIFDTDNEIKGDGTEKKVTEYVSEYVSATASVVVQGDAIAEDNSITLYGGVKPMLKVQYSSPTPSLFFSASLMSIENALRNRWDLDIDEVRGENAVSATSGYDLYIFEKAAPAVMPTDGVVFLVNVPVMPTGFGVMLDSIVANTSINLISPDAHTLVKNMDVSKLLVTSYTPIASYPEGFTPIMFAADRPVFIAKNTADEKIAVMSFSLNYSDFPVTLDFPIFMYNIFEYFIPSTFNKYIFEVNDAITFNARGAELKVTGGGTEEKLIDLPAEHVLTQIGTYITTQTLFNNVSTITEYFFVKMPVFESDITPVIDLMPGSVVKPVPTLNFDDLLVYFAAALVALVLLEWWLQSRSGI